MMKLFDSELEVMEILWEKNDLTASEIAKILDKKIGWNRNTTYTIIKKCVNKGAIERHEPSFLCHAIVTKSDVQLFEASKLVDKLFEKSVISLFSIFLENDKLTQADIQQLKSILDSK